MVALLENRGSRSLNQADLAQRQCGDIVRQCPGVSLSQTEGRAGRQGKKMSPKGPDASQFVWMLQMWHYGDRGFMPMKKDCGEKKERQATQAQDAQATQLGHAGPQQDRSG